MTKKIKKLLIANRGEIALRIIRAAKELGIETYQIYSLADEQSLAVKCADHSICVGAARATESYLNIDVILQVAKDKEVDAIHPGYGFLSESAEFADRVIQAGIIFVGPDGDVMRKMADKSMARQTAINAGVPVVLGSQDVLSDVDNAFSLAEEIGFPVMIKASAGGGGRGIRIVSNPVDFHEQFHQALAEATAAFGDGRLYIEKFIKQSRHIEVQVLGDGKSAVHFFERECSLQRRRQKVWEEAPCCFIDEDTRQRMCHSAVELAKNVSYRGAGTVEYLYDELTQEFYFIEMNTRIQVEHPITEQITGVDLVREMINISAGEPLSFQQSDISMKGHSIEIRLNAEDPFNQFMPNPGEITNLVLPQGLGVRFDGQIHAGFKVSPYYDSLLGKLIVSDATRDKAINRLMRALDELEVDGIKTTAPLFRLLCEEQEVRDGRVHTNWLEHWINNDNALKQE